MAQVETMQGPVEVDDLGPTLMHEHVFVLSTEHVQNYGEGAWWDEEAAGRRRRREADDACGAQGHQDDRRPDGHGARAATSRASSGSPRR